MYYFYILKNISTSELYFGCTADLRKRFAQHNSSKVKSTRLKVGWKLIYYEAYVSKVDVFHREYSIKLRGNAYLQLKKRIKNCVVEAQ